jgi:hypothetical protein
MMILEAIQLAQEMTMKLIPLRLGNRAADAAIEVQEQTRHSNQEVLTLNGELGGGP